MTTRTKWSTPRGRKLWLAAWARLGLRVANWMRVGGVPWYLVQPINGNKVEE